MPIPRAVFRILSVTCLLTCKALCSIIFSDYVEGYCIHIRISMWFNGRNNLYIIVTVVVSCVDMYAHAQRGLQ